MEGATDNDDDTLGLNIMVLGSSNMRNICPYLREKCDSKGIHVVSCVKGGNFMEFFRGRDASFLGSGTPNDVLVLNYMRTEMLT